MTRKPDQPLVGLEILLMQKEQYNNKNIFIDQVWLSTCVQRNDKYCSTQIGPVKMILEGIILILRKAQKCLLMR